MNDPGCVYLFGSGLSGLGIVRAMPNDEMIGQYEMTAGELAQWLAQWEREPAEGPLKESKS